MRNLLKNHITPILTFLWLMLLPLGAGAQAGFDDTLSIDEIKARMKEAVANQRFREQGVLWYKWAYYEWNTYGNRALMFEYLTRSATRFLRERDSLAYFRVRAELAELLPDENSNDEALRIQEEALSYFRRHRHEKLEVPLLVHLAHIYNMKNDSAKADVFKKAFREKNDVLRDTLLEIRLHMNEMRRYQREKRFNDALYRAYRVRDLATRINRPELAAWAAYQIGALNYQNNEPDIALKALLAAEKYDLRLYDTLRRSIYRDIAQIYGRRDSLRQAFDYARKCMWLSEQMLVREREATYQRLTEEYGVEQREKRLGQLEEKNILFENIAEQQRLVSGALAVALSASVLALIIVVRDYRHRLRTNRLIAEQKEKINQQTIRQLEDALRIESMQSMIEGQESERRRVAHDLHDSLGGLLAATKIRLENLGAKVAGLASSQEYAKIKTLLDETIAETRQISRNLQPGSLHQFGLMKAIRDLIGRVQGDGVPAIDFQHFGDFSNLDHTKALNCYRIVQELLQNSLKHAKATEILVQLSRTETELTLLVEDNGQGYDPALSTKGMGTDNVAQRVQFIKGEISIQSAEGQGTSTMITVPLP